MCLGGFRNVRAVHEWKALKLELDECGTRYRFKIPDDVDIAMTWAMWDFTTKMSLYQVVSLSSYNKNKNDMFLQ